MAKSTSCSIVIDILRGNLVVINLAESTIEDKEFFVVQVSFILF